MILPIYPLVNIQKTNMTHRNSGFTQLQNGGSFHSYVATFTISGKPPFSYGFPMVFPLKLPFSPHFCWNPMGLQDCVKPYETPIFVGSTSPILWCFCFRICPAGHFSRVTWVGHRRLRWKWEGDLAMKSIGKSMVWYGFTWFNRGNNDHHVWSRRYFTKAYV